MMMGPVCTYMEEHEDRMNQRPRSLLIEDDRKES